MPIRLHITAEGATEERFVNKVLAPYLGERAVWVDVRCVLTSKDNRCNVVHRGGWRRTNPYTTVKKDIIYWMKEDRNPDVRFTTMFDLYALPPDFPGYEEARNQRDPYQRVAMLEAAFRVDIVSELDDPRFFPYIQLHEFEALILADPRQLEWEFLDHDKAIQRLVDMVTREGGNPESIDDGITTAPSKRISAEIREYQSVKATSGPLVVEKIGMPVLLDRCQHFAQWVAELVRLGVEPSRYQR